MMELKMWLFQVMSVVLVLYLFGNTGAKPFPKQLMRRIQRERRHVKMITASSKHCNQTLHGSGYTSTSDVSLLYKNGWFLAIYSDGNINGTSDARSPDIKLQLQSVGTSKVRIFSKQKCLYVAMAANGKVYTTEEPTDDTVFQQTQESNGFETFASNKHITVSRYTRKFLFLSMRKNGQIKNGTHTRRNNKTSLLSVMQARETN